MTTRSGTATASPSVLRTAVAALLGGLLGLVAWRALVCAGFSSRPMEVPYFLMVSGAVVGVTMHGRIRLLACIALAVALVAAKLLLWDWRGREGLGCIYALVCVSALGLLSARLAWAPKNLGLRAIGGSAIGIALPGCILTTVRLVPVRESIQQQLYELHTLIGACDVLLVAIGCSILFQRDAAE